MKMAAVAKVLAESLQPQVKNIYRSSLFNLLRSPAPIRSYLAARASMCLASCSRPPLAYSAATSRSYSGVARRHRWTGRPGVWWAVVG